LEIQKKWFAESTPVNAKQASAQIGSGTNGTVTIKYDIAGTEGNVYEVAVVVAEGKNKDMSAALANGVITVTLGTGADSNPAATKNTAKLIAEEISDIDGFTATYSGEGTSSISQATTDNVAFEGGQYATFCPIGGVWLYIGTTYYYCSKPCGRRTMDAWQTVAFTTI
jgi:hypothetical protein